MNNLKNMYNLSPNFPFIPLFLVMYNYLQCWCFVFNAA